jgi:hypothetical protein
MLRFCPSIRVCTAEFPRTGTPGRASLPIMSKTFRRYVPKQDLLAPPSLPIGYRRWQTLEKMVFWLQRTNW